MSAQAPPIDPALARFFAAVVPYYAGVSSHDAVERALGASASGRARLEFYRRLMAANRRRTLAAVFPLVARVVAEPERAGLAAGSLPTWAELVEAFAVDHPSASWDPNAFGEPFAAWVARRPELPPGLAELADWSWRMLAAARAEGELQPRALAPGVHPAAYSFDVAAWAAAFEAGAAPPLEEAAGAGPPVVLVAFRDRSSARVRVLRPSPADLVAMARAAGEGSLEVPGLGPAELAAAHARLTDLGVIGGAP